MQQRESRDGEEKGREKGGCSYTVQWRARARGSCRELLRVFCATLGHPARRRIGGRALIQCNRRARTRAALLRERACNTRRPPPRLFISKGGNVAGSPGKTKILDPTVRRGPNSVPARMFLRAAREQSLRAKKKASEDKARFECFEESLEHELRNIAQHRARLKINQVREVQSP